MEDIDRETRLIDSSDSDEEDPRTPFQRDRDRILYTRYFRRLGQITQVAPAYEGYSYHNRLTHTIKVAQVGRRLAQYLQNTHDRSEIRKAGGLDPDVVEAAALAHDLGHPPFGHAAEEFLMEKLDNDLGLIGGFEGNPQSFRIVTKLAIRSGEYQGLNLTCATLNAMLKYPWQRNHKGDSRKWGYYQTELDTYEKVRALKTPGGNERGMSLEARVMDWADDITYAIHDLTDFYRAGMIPLDRILDSSSEREEVIEAFHQEHDNLSARFHPEEFLEDNIKKLAEVASPTDEIPMKSPFEPVPSNIGNLNYFGSQLIERYLGTSSDITIEVDHSVKHGLKIIPERLEDELKLLKFLTKYYVFQDSRLLTYQEGERKMIEEVFDCLYEASAEDSDLNGIIPEPFYTLLEQNVYENSSETSIGSEEMRARIVSDLIVSLSEHQLSELYERISGQSHGSLTARLFF